MKLNNSNFNELSNMNTFVWLLSNEDIYVNVEIAKYLSNIVSFFEIQNNADLLYPALWDI